MQEKRCPRVQHTPFYPPILFSPPRPPHLFFFLDLSACPHIRPAGAYFALVERRAARLSSLQVLVALPPSGGASSSCTPTSSASLSATVGEAFLLAPSLVARAGMPDQNRRTWFSVALVTAGSTSDSSQPCIGFSHKGLLLTGKTYCSHC